MLHKTLAAKATTTTEKGEFTAIAAAYTVDRVKDKIVFGAFEKTIEQWRASGKKIPLHWDHRGRPEYIIGHVDPAQMEEQKGVGLVVGGMLDLEGSELAREAWRLMKSGVLGLSFGYLTPRERKASGGINELLELDLFEITVAPHPVNPDTRFLSLKSEQEQRDEADRVEREANDEQVEEAEPVTGEIVDEDPKPTADEVLMTALGLPDEELAALKEGLGFKPEPAKSEEELRADADRIAREAEQAQIPETPEPELTAIGKALKAINPLDATLDRVAETIDGIGADDTHLHVRVITGDELAGIQDGLVKAVWSAAYVNNLPDSAFLHIEPGGKKDSEGKTTPRSLRHFPVKDADGNVDLAHLRNALARIPQSNLPQSVKDACTRKAQRMLDQSKSVDVTDDEDSRPVDPLRERADTVALEYASGGISRQKPPKYKASPRPEPRLSLDELREQCREHLLAYISEDTRS